MLNTDKIYFYPYKIFEVERRKYLYNIYILFMQVGFLKLIIPYLSYYN